MRRIWGVRSPTGLTLPITHGAAQGEELAGGELTAGTSYRLVMTALSGATFFVEFTP